MPGILLDDGTWREIDIPSTTTIGRASGNDVQPESQSISKNHASLTLGIGHRGKLHSELKDFDSRNGSFYGPSPYDREMQRVKGTQKIDYGTYLKFGNCHTYFQFLEHQPAGTPLAYDAAAVAEQAAEDEKNNSASSLQKSNSENTENGSLFIPLIPEAPLQRTASPVLHSSSSGENYSSNRASNPQPLRDSNNMMISIQYPTGETNPVSIHIDPKGQQGPPQATHNSNSKDWDRGRSAYRRSEDQREQLSSPARDRGDSRDSRDSRDAHMWEDVVRDREREGSSERGGGGLGGGVLESPQNSELGGISRGVQRYNSQAEGSEDVELPPLRGQRGERDRERGGLPPPLADAMDEHSPSGGRHFNRNPNSADVYAGLQHRGQFDDHRDSHSHHQGREQGRDHDNHNPNIRVHDHKPFPLSPIRGSFPMPFVTHGVNGADAKDKPNVQLVRRVWPDLSGLTITHLAGRVIAELAENQVSSTYKEDSPAPTTDDIEGELPDYCIAEAAADR